MLDLMSNFNQVAKANKLMNIGNYSEALAIYKNLILQDERLESIFKLNIDICENRLKGINSSNKIKSYIAPKISILVPTYNVELYIKECLDSLISQHNIDELEIICINDGSTDSSIEILYQYQSKYDFIKIINQPNSGYGAALNTGLKHATGEYIGIVEPDDYISSNMYQELIKLTYEEANIDIIRATAIAFTKDGPLDGLYGLPPKGKFDYSFNTNINPHILTSPPAIWTSIYRRKFLIENNIILPESLGASYQDVSFFIQTMIHAKKIKVTWKPFYFYRNDNMSASRFSKGKVDVIFDMYDWLSNKLDLYNSSWKRQIVDRMMNDFKWSYGRVDDIYKNRYLNNVNVYINKFDSLNIGINDFDPKFHSFYKEVTQKSNYRKRGCGGFTIQKDQPIISLITPIYNAQNYIKEFLDSIINQDHSDYEIILVNDFSKDNTLDILNSYDFKTLKYKIVSLSQNKGASNARNVGLNYASGIYIRFIDCDDILPEGSLGYMKSMARQYRSDIFKGYLYGYDYKSGKVFQNLWGGRNYQSQLSINQLPENSPDCWNLYDHQAFLIRRDLIEKHKIEYPILKNYQDPPFIAKCLSVANKVTILPKDVYHLVCNRGIKTITRSEWDIDNFRALISGTKQALNILSESGLYMITKHKIMSFIPEWFDKLTIIGKWEDKKLRDEIFDNIRSFQLDYSISLFNINSEPKYQILAFMIANQRYDDACEFLAKVRNIHKPDKAYLYYYPFWDEKNPYLNKVYGGISDLNGRGTIIDAIVRCMNVKNQVTVFHLHWTDLYIQKANILDKVEAHRAAYYYIYLFELFRKLGGKLVWTMHNFHPHELNYITPEKILMDGILKYSNHIIVHTDEGRRYLLDNYKFDEKKIIIARHGHYIGCYKDDLSISQSRESFELHENEIHFVFFGQVRAYKGIEQLIQAFNKLALEYNNIRLTIAGSFPDKSYKEQLLAMVESQSNNLIMFKEGFIKDDELQRYVKSSDFIVLPYKKILTSGSILLALSFASPVIATKCDVVNDLIQNEVNGFIFDNNLYDILHKAYHLNREDKEKMRQKAYEVALRNDWKPMQQTINDILTGSI